MAGPGLYAGVSDVAAYLSKTPTAQQSTWLRLISVASRGIDRYCDRYFYPESTGTKYFDVDGDPYTGRDTWPPNGARGGKMLFLYKHDFYSLTALKVAQIENGNPANPSDWITLTGDGITPPSDFYLEPANQTFLGKDGSALVQPFWWVQLPAFGPLISTSFRGYFTSGKRTVSLTASWGWPAVPDDIQDITVKIVVRMFKAQSTGFTGVIGSPDGGQATILKYLDINDLNTLNGYKKWASTF